ncbi:MAG: radical SAM protein [Cyclobacteriaceae bacterium]
MKKKVYLIQPSFRKMDGKVVKGWSQVNCSLDLPMISASIPGEWEKDLCFEYYDDINFDTDATVIFLTAMTNDIRHAYNIAERLQSEERKIIFGGHLDAFAETLMAEVCDTIYYGIPGPKEIGMLLDDAYHGNLKSEYHFGVNINFPFDYSLFRDKHVRYLQIMTSVGCRFSCDYCCYQMYYGGKFWLRDLDYVMADLKQAIKQTKTIAFRDINIYNDRKNLKDLCERIIDEKINFRWGAQCPIYVGNDEEILHLMKKAGCKMIFVGLETLIQENLDSVHKPFKVSMYRDCIANIRKAGINVAGYFMFGLDYDTPGVFDQVYDFVQENELSLVLLNIYIPNPGSKLFERMKDEGRADIHDERTFMEVDPIYGMPNSHVYFTPKNISREDLQKGFVNLARRLTSYKQILHRSLQPNIEAMTILMMNLDQRRDRIKMEKDPEFAEVNL